MQSKPSRPLRIIITSGPGSEPIDEVRRITNFSTGYSGIFLGNYFHERGHRVTCLISANRTCHDSLLPSDVREFITTQDLNDRLHALKGQADIIFHAAALSDFQISQVTDGAGNPFRHLKIPSNQPLIRIELKTAPKLIRQLRSLFPQAKIIGWKYELDDSPETAVQKALKQIATNKTDACVLNGSAISSKYIFCTADGNKTSLSSLEQLAEKLATYCSA